MFEIIGAFLKMLKFCLYLLGGVIAILIHLGNREIGHSLLGIGIIYSWFFAVNVYYMPYHTPYWYGCLHIIIIIGYFYREGCQLMRNKEVQYARKSDDSYS